LSNLGRLQTDPNKSAMISIWIVGIIWILTQAIWQSQGVERDFSLTPSYVTPLRIAALAILLVIAVSRGTVDHINKKYLLIAIFCAAITFWGMISDYFGTGRIGLNGETYTYLFLTLITLALARTSLNLRQGVLLINRLVIWSSLLFAVLVPHAAFGAGSSRLAFIGSQTRLSGVVGDANTLSFFALVLIALSLEGRRKLNRLDVLLAIVVLVLTQSRFGAIIAGVIFIIYFVSKRTHRILATVIPISFVVGFSILIFGLSQKLSAFNIDGSDFWNTRLVIWNWAVTTISSEPITGLGLPNYYQAINQSGSFWVHSHNQILQDILIGGYVRGFLILAFLVVMSYIAQKLAKDRASIFLIATVLMFGQVEVPLFLDSFNYRFLGLFLILIWICSANDNSDDSPDRLSENSDTAQLNRLKN